VTVVVPPPPPAAPARPARPRTAGAALRAGFGVPWKAFRRFRDNSGPQMAAVVAYYVLFSIIPALALLIATFGVMLGDPRLRASVTRQALDMLPFGTADNRALIVGTLEAVRHSSGGLSIAGFLGLAWATLGMFGATRWALNRAFRVEGRRGLLRGWLVDLISAFMMWLLLTLSLAVTAALEWLRARAAVQADWASRPLDWTWSVLPFVLPTVFTYTAFLLLYRFVPNVQHRWRQVAPAALTGAVLFELAKHGFAWYVRTFTRYQSLYGALGGVMLFMLWVYLSAAILLYGAEIASAHQREDQPPPPG
jgi:membrane protein